MHQLFIICYIISVITAVVLFKKIGFWWALAIAFGLPILLFAIANILLIAGGDK